MSTLIGIDDPAAPPSADTGDLVKDSDTAAFAADVIDGSMTVPVIVDFWAPWCGPCKTLGPALEKAVKNARGAVKMVKVNIDDNQELAARMRVQSIPAVYAFFQGRPVDGFVGAQPESQLGSFVKRLIDMAGTDQGPSPVEQALEEANAALEAGQYGPASALYGQVLRHEPENPVATAGSIRCGLGAGDTEQARRMFDGLPAEMRNDPALAAVKAALDLADAGAGAGEIPGLRERLVRNQGDHQARFDLAMALHGADQREAAVDQLLDLMARDRTWNEEAARKQLLQFFEAWGPKDPLTLESRRRLSSLLFS